MSKKNILGSLPISGTNSPSFFSPIHPTMFLKSHYSILKVCFQSIKSHLTPGFIRFNTGYDGDITVLHDLVQLGVKVEAHLCCMCVKMFTKPISCCLNF